MKKLIAMLLCLSLVAALGASAFAAYPTDPVDDKSDTAQETSVKAAMDPYIADREQKIEWIKIESEIYGVVKEYETAMKAAEKLTGFEKAAAENAATSHLTKELTALGALYTSFPAAYFDPANYTGAAPTFTSQVIDNEITIYEGWVAADDHALDLLADDFAKAKAIGDTERAKAKLVMDYEKIAAPTAIDTAKLNVALNKIDADNLLTSAKAYKDSAEKTYSAAAKSVASAQKAAKGVVSDVVALAKVEAAAAVATAQAAAYAAAASQYQAAVANFNTEVSKAVADALTELGF